MIKFNRMLVPAGLLAMIFIFMPSCSEEEINDPLAEGFVEFSLGQIDKDLPAGRLTDLDQLRIILSIEQENGATVLNSEEVKLKKWGDSYVSTPIRLISGNYFLTEFMIIDKNYEVLWAAPIALSPLAYLSDNPLPLEFRIFAGESSAVTPEVMSTTGFRPQDFGYATFSFEKIKTLNFDIRVYNLNRTTNTYELTSANLKVSGMQNVILYEGELGPDINSVTVRDEYSDYYISVTKTNRIPFDTVITNTDIKKFVEEKDGPLDVYLDDGMIIWNKLGSSAELANSEVGPPVSVSVPNFALAKFGNGLYAQNGSQIARIAAGEVNQYIPNPLLEPWTIEAWYKPDYAVSNNRIVGSVPNGRSSVVVFNCWKWDASIGGIRIMPIEGGYGGPTDVNADFIYYKSSFPTVYHIFRPDNIDNDVSWSAGDLVHLAVVFDPDGNDGGPRFELYVNGILHGHSSETQIYEYAPPVVAWPVYIGGDDIYRVANGVVDNLKVFNLAKTDFNDRNTE